MRSIVVVLCVQLCVLCVLNTVRFKMDFLPKNDTLGNHHQKNWICRAEKIVVLGKHWDSTWLHRLKVSIITEEIILLRSHRILGWFDGRIATTEIGGRTFWEAWSLAQQAPTLKAQWFTPRSRFVQIYYFKQMVVLENPQPNIWIQQHRGCWSPL